MGNLLSVFSDSDYISVNDVIHAIHRHIGLDKDISMAEDIFLSILNKEQSKIYSKPPRIYQKIAGLWHEVKKDSNDQMRIVENIYRGTKYYYFETSYQAIAFVISTNKENRENDLPF